MIEDHNIRLIINDVRELSLPIQEQRLPSGYIHLVKATDIPESYFFEGDHRIKFSKKRVGDIGNVELLLAKDVRPSPNVFYSPEFYLSSRGIERISHEEAKRNGLYGLNLFIKNSVARFRGSEFFANVSMDGQTDMAVCKFRNESEIFEGPGRLPHDPPIEQGTSLTSAGWRQAEDQAFIVPSGLNISFGLEDRIFLEDLYFKFIVAHPLQKGSGNGY